MRKGDWVTVTNTGSLNPYRVKEGMRGKILSISKWVNCTVYDIEFDVKVCSAYDPKVCPMYNTELTLADTTYSPAALTNNPRAW